MRWLDDLQEYFADIGRMHPSSYYRDEAGRVRPKPSAMERTAPQYSPYTAEGTAIEQPLFDPVDTLSFGAGTALRQGLKAGMMDMAIDPMMAAIMSQGSEGQAMAGPVGKKGLNALAVRAYHGGASDPGDFSRGASRGHVGKAYFNDSQEVANQYAALGGIDLNYGFDDMVDLLSEGGKLSGRNAVVTPVDLEFNNPLDAEMVTWDDILETIGPERIKDKIKDDSALEPLVENYWQRVVHEGGDWQDAMDISPAGYLDKHLDEYLSTQYNDDRLSAILQNDGDSLKQTTEGFRFLVLADLLDEYAKKKGYDGTYFPDTEAGGITYVPFDLKTIKSPFKR